MKLVTFDEGRVGRVQDEEVVELDVPSMRALFEASELPRTTGRAFSLSDVRLRAPIVPKKFLHTAGNFGSVCLPSGVSPNPNSVGSRK